MPGGGDLAHSEPEEGPETKIESYRLSAGWESRVLDDVWSVIFVFIDLVVGCLPWTAAARCRDKTAVGASKTDMCCAAAAMDDVAPTSPPKKNRRINIKDKKAPAVQTDTVSKPLKIISWILEELNAQQVREGMTILHLLFR
jgi:hypothetical protein